MKLIAQLHVFAITVSHTCSLIHFIHLAQELIALLLNSCLAILANSLCFTHLFTNFVLITLFTLTLFIFTFFLQCHCKWLHYHWRSNARGSECTFMDVVHLTFHSHFLFLHFPFHSHVFLSTHMCSFPLNVFLFTHMCSFSLTCVPFHSHVFLFTHMCSFHSHVFLFTHMCSFHSLCSFSLTLFLFTHMCSFSLTVFLYTHCVPLHSLCSFSLNNLFTSVCTFFHTFLQIYWTISNSCTHFFFPICKAISPVRGRGPTAWTL